jgi:hypothetical protein
MTGWEWKICRTLSHTGIHSLFIAYLFIHSFIHSGCQVVRAGVRTQDPIGQRESFSQ